MAKYTVYCTKCGKEETIEVFGKHADRERKLEWMAENHLCLECYREHEKATKKSYLVEVGNGKLYVESPSSYDIKEELKGLGYKWDSNYKMWCQVMPDGEDEETTEWIIARLEELSKYDFCYAYEEWTDAFGKRLELTLDDLRHDTGILSEYK